MTDERKMRVYVNSGANMSRGKYAAQAIHAALMAVGAHPDVPVVVLGANREQIEKLPVQVRDAGRTEVEPGTLTAGTDWAPEPPLATVPNVIGALIELEQWTQASGAPATNSVIRDALRALGAPELPSLNRESLPEGQHVRYVGRMDLERDVFARHKVAVVSRSSAAVTLVDLDDGRYTLRVNTYNLVASRPCASCGSSNNNGMACFSCGATDADG